MHTRKVVQKYKNQKIYGNDTFALRLCYVGGKDIVTASAMYQKAGSRKMYSHLGYTFEQQNFFVIPEDFRWSFLSWHVLQNSFIYEPLEKFILNCHQHGIMTHLIDKLIPSQSKERKEGPKVLTTFMLSAGFYIWLTSVLIAFIVFILEHVHFAIAKRMPAKGKVAPMVKNFSTFKKKSQKLLKICKFKSKRSIGVHSKRMHRRKIKANIFDVSHKNCGIVFMVSEMILAPLTQLNSPSGHVRSREKISHNIDSQKLRHLQRKFWPDILNRKRFIMVKKSKEKEVPMN